jgi:hypothetical protein
MPRDKRISSQPRQQLIRTISSRHEFPQPLSCFLVEPVGGFFICCLASSTRGVVELALFLGCRQESYDINGYIRVAAGCDCRGKDIIAFRLENGDFDPLHFLAGLAQLTISLQKTTSFY